MSTCGVKAFTMLIYSLINCLLYVILGLS